MKRSIIVKDFVQIYGQKNVGKLIYSGASRFPMMGNTGVDSINGYGNTQQDYDLSTWKSYGGLTGTKCGME